MNPTDHATPLRLSLGYFRWPDTGFWKKPPRGSEGLSSHAYRCSLARQCITGSKVSASCFLLSAFCFLLSASCFLLPAGCFLPPASCLLPATCLWRVSRPALDVVFASFNFHKSGLPPSLRTGALPILHLPRSPVTLASMLFFP
jgi:hypothetical protein